MGHPPQAAGRPRVARQSRPVLTAIEAVGRQADARAAETEGLRRLPDDLAAALVGTGVFRLCVPRRYGGAEAQLLETIHRAKTGALLRASLRLGAIYAGADDSGQAALSCYGEHIGLAFQIVDDILDVEESSEALGKTAGKDAQQHKITFPAVYGLEQSRRMAEQECERSHFALQPFGDRAARLHELADLIVHRKS